MVRASEEGKAMGDSALKHEPATPRTTDRPRSDEGWWLYEYQKLVVNVQGLVSRGQSESAMRIMLDMGRRWSEAKDV